MIIIQTIIIIDEGNLAPLINNSQVIYCIQIETTRESIAMYDSNRISNSYRSQTTMIESQSAYWSDRIWNGQRNRQTATTIKSIIIYRVQGIWQDNRSKSTATIKWTINIGWCIETNGSQSYKIL